MRDEPTSRRDEAFVGRDPVRRAVRIPAEPGPMPSWPDMRAVLMVCVPSWAGLTWLIAEWL